MRSHNINCIELNRNFLTLLHSDSPKLHTILAFLSAIGLDLYLSRGLKIEWFSWHHNLHIIKREFLSQIIKNG